MTSPTAIRTSVEPVPLLVPDSGSMTATVAGGIDFAVVTRPTPPADALLATNSASPAATKLGPPARRSGLPPAPRRVRTPTIPPTSQRRNRIRLYGTVTGILYAVGALPLRSDRRSRPRELDAGAAAQDRTRA